MTDLVKRLRLGIHTSVDEQALRDEAADRIETLEAELHSCFHRIEELQAALRELACKCVSNCDWEKGDICPSWTARKALEGKDD